MHENLVKFGRAVFDLYEWTDRQTDRQTDIHRPTYIYTYSSQYFAPFSWFPWFDKGLTSVRIALITTLWCKIEYLRQEDYCMLVYRTTWKAIVKDHSHRKRCGALRCRAVSCVTPDVVFCRAAHHASGFGVNEKLFLYLRRHVTLTEIFYFSTEVSFFPFAA